MDQDYPFWVYILGCADGSYYVGSHRGQDARNRVDEHQQGVHPRAYTARRWPVTLVYAATFDSVTDAIGWERQLKGWNRRKKEAVIAGRWEDLPALARTHGTRTASRLDRFLREHSPSVDSDAANGGAADLVLRQAQDEV